ncbi:MAG: DUF1566 domain-containing protein [Campylobacterota bacterium]|nr:DUF1566 domain-containing protein [Campylobacterota bacterium]
MSKLLILFLLPLSLLSELYEIPNRSASYENAKQECKMLDGGPWRLLTIQELYTLKGRTDIFSKNESFWAINTLKDGIAITSTGSEGEGISPEGTTKGYSFYLQDGDISVTPLQKKVGVICSDNPLPDIRYNFKKGPYGVIDADNDIIWMTLDASNKKKRYTHEKAIEFCEAQSYLKREWRLPSLDELYGIVDYSRTRPTVNTHLFGMMMHRYYWSEDEFNENESYVVGFKFGSIATSSNKNRSYVRCVSDME